MDEAPLLTVGAVAEALDVHPVTVYRAIHQGELPAVRLGARRLLRVRRDDLERALQSWRVEGERA